MDYQNIVNAHAERLPTLGRVAPKLPLTKIRIHNILSRPNSKLDRLEPIQPRRIVRVHLPLQRVKPAIKPILQLLRLVMCEVVPLPKVFHVVVGDGQGRCRRIARIFVEFRESTLEQRLRILQRLIASECAP